MQMFRCHLTLRTYLLPEDANLRKLIETEEGRFRGQRLLKPRPVRSLQMNGFYALHADCDAIINPEELSLRYSSITPNFSEVCITEASDFSVELLSSGPTDSVESKSQED